jgi:phospholipase C
MGKDRKTHKLPDCWLSLGLLVYLGGCGNASNSDPDSSIPGFDKIQHIVFIVKENHSFDNYSGTFPGAPMGQPQA